MNKLFFCLLLIASIHTRGQESFLKFVESREVKFASYSTDTFHFANPNLSLQARERLLRGKLKATIPADGPAPTGNQKFSGTEAIRARIAPNREIKVVDSDGVVTSTVKETEDPLLSPRYFDAQTTDMVEVPILFYIANGKLNTYVPYFSVKYAVFTSWGQKLGVSNAFMTGFNNRQKIKSSIKRKAKLVGTSTNWIRLDTIPAQPPVKQLYGQNILQALWPALGKNSFEIYRLDSNRRISFQNLHMGLLKQINVPVYDADGKLESSNRYPMETLPLLPSEFVSLQLKSDWYYNERKNILYSVITEMQLFPRETGDRGGKSEATLKILVK